jgi:hypothetical protein
MFETQNMTLTAFVRYFAMLQLCEVTTELLLAAFTKHLFAFICTSCRIIAR